MSKNLLNITLDAILESVACGVMVTDEHLRIKRLNRSAELITGWSVDEALGKPCHEVLQPVLEEGICPLEGCLRRGSTREEKILSIRNRKGDEVPVRVVSYILRNEEGDLLGGVQTFGDMSTVHELRTKLQRSHAFHGILSRNHIMRNIFEVLPRMAESSSTVLIRGESGTGKELVARALHNLSPHEDGPFVAVNCAALPDTLLEAELFGYVKGAFTDARSDREGRVAMAEGGTLFVDEVGDISPAMQVKLLRFLQDRSYEPLGSSKTRKANVRVVAATNRNLEQLLANGQFREDFFYRLNVLTIDLPPLRDRLEDVPLLVDHMLATWALLNGRDTMRITPLALRALMSYDFPGNVRELENIVERAAVLAEDDNIDLSNLPDEVQETIRGTRPRENGALIPSSRFTPVELAERETIRDALARHHHSRLDAAKDLGMSRTTLWRKMRKYLLD